MSATRLTLAVLAVAAFAVLLAPHKPQTAPITPADVTVSNPAAATQQLSGFLRLKTVGDDRAEAENHVGVNETKAFADAHEFFSENFPALWNEMSVTRVSNWSLLLKWEGRNAALKPVALLSHIDVVGADESADSKWSVDPFSGKVQDGYIYGRGAIDLKSNIIAILHAANQLITEGFQPQRSVYLAFGHDEELGGSCGAAKIVKLLQSQKVELEMVLDEGGIIIQDGLPPLTDTPIAVVGTAEKDFSVMSVTVKSPGGHSSMPPVDGSSVGAMLARVVSAVDRSPPPVTLQPPMTDFVSALADAAPVKGVHWLLRYARVPLVGKLIGTALTYAPDTAALVRTTSALVRLEAGQADNVQPSSGAATWNFRHLPGHTPEQLMEYLQSKINAKDRPHAEVRRLDEHSSHSHISPLGPHFQLLKRVIKETMAEPGTDILVAPYLVIGATDAKHYESLTENILRFEPVPISRHNKDLKRIHGIDERIHQEDFVKQIRFFIHFIKTACGSNDIA